MTKALLLLLSLSFSFFSYAQVVKKINGGYQIKMEDIDLPKKTLNKAFKSGIKTELFYTISIISGKKEVLIEKGSLNVRYDLWDEVFELTESQGKSLKLKDLSTVYNHIENRSVGVRRKDISSLPTKIIKLRTVFLLNPINREKSKKIKEWIAERNVGRSSSGRAVSAASGSVFSGIVNRVVMGDLDKDIYGADKKFIFLSPDIDLRRMK